MGFAEAHAEQADVEIPLPRVTRTSKKEVAKKQISMMLDVVDNVAQGVAGPPAAMRRYERDMIEIPAHVYAETHTKEVQWASEKFAPLTIALGLSLYLKRVMRSAGYSIPNPLEALKPKPKQQPRNLAPVIPIESQRTASAEPVNVEQPDQPEPPAPVGLRPITADDIFHMTSIGGRN